MATKKVAGKNLVRVAKRETEVVRDSARDLWLASLGAMSITRKQGTKLFGTLINEGQGLNQRTVKLVDGTVADVKSKVSGVIGKVQQSAAANLAQVEDVVGTQVGRVLSRLGIPSKGDIQELSRRVSELNRQVKALQNARKAPEAKAA